MRWPAPADGLPGGAELGPPLRPGAGWRAFDLAAVDKLLVGWTWHRQVGAKTGQLSFANVNVGVGKAWAGRIATLRFDPEDRQVVVHAPGTRPKERGPELKRVHCAAFDKEVILGQSQIAWHPLPAQTTRPPDTLPEPTALRPYGT